MTIPYYTDEDTVSHDSHEQCAVEKDKEPCQHTEIMKECASIMDSTILSSFICMLSENSIKHVFLFGSNLDINRQIYIALWTILMVIHAVLFWKNLVKSCIPALKTGYLFHRVKIKVKWSHRTNHIRKSKLGGNNFESEWIFNNIISPFRVIPQYVFSCFPFFPQEYSSIISDRRQHRNLEAMKYEGPRFATFADFPVVEGIYATRLAEAGFYYTGNTDEVECYSCRVKHRNWDKRDIPMDVHRRISPYCSFLVINAAKELDENTASSANHQDQTGAAGSTRDFEHKNPRKDSNCSTKATNVTVTQVSNLNGVNLNRQPSVDCDEMILFRSGHSSNTNSSAHNSSRSYNDTRSLIRIPTEEQTTSNVRHNTQQCVTSTQMYRNNQPSDSMSMGVCIDKPKYPKYAIKSTRLESFEIWPRHLTQSPEEMTTAGFFFTGIEDHCRCFFCGGGLKNWEPTDRPWVEHARWYQNCAFLRQCKGDKFIEDVLLNRLDTNQQNKQDEQKVQSQATSSRNMEFSNHPAVLSVSEFGYDPNLVKKAFDLLRQTGSIEITGSMLLEKLFHLEETMRRNGLTKTVETEPSQRSGENGQTSAKHENSETNHTLSRNDNDLELSVKSLEEENQNLRDQQTCKICLDEPIAIVFLPCGHMASCINCAPALRRCPICRTFIKGTVKAIMS